MNDKGIRAGRGVWACGNCGKWFHGDEDSPKCTGCGDEDHAMAVASISRVHGDHYKPYQGSTLWATQANQSLALTAQENFANRR